MFNNYSVVSYWRVDLSINNQFTTGKATLILKKNLLPTDGDCFVDKTSGTSLLTWFTIKCTHWIDPDGFISTYEYFGNFLKISLKLNYSSSCQKM